MPVFDMPNDGACEVLGVSGRWIGHTIKPGQKLGTWFQQKWISGVRTYTENGRLRYWRVEMRFDDSCNNGHNTFAITAEGGDATPTKEPGKKYYSLRSDCGGCAHDEIAKYFPEFAPLIPFHLCDANGPMHYIANTLYFAGNRDCWGKTKGEPKSFEERVRVKGSPVSHSFGRTSDSFLAWIKTRLDADGRAEFTPLEVAHVNRNGTDYKFGPKFTFDGYAADWYSCPFDSLGEASEWAQAFKDQGVDFHSVCVSWGEGKERELDAARRAAVWPDATDEQLSLPKDELKALLEARQPALVAEFRELLERAGFYWSPQETENKPGAWRAGS